MNRLPLFAIFLALLVVTGPAFASDEARPQKGAPAGEHQDRPQAGAALNVNQAELDAAKNQPLPSGVDLAGRAPVPERQANPMMLEIRTVLEAAREQSNALQQQFQAATNEGEALGIQRELEKLMQDSEIEILEIQARYARARGDEDLAEDIEANIANIREPQVPIERANRPRPDASN